MPNSAGVVGPDYITPIDLGFGTATAGDVAQAVVDLGILTDSTATITPAATVFSLDYLSPVEADLSGVVSVATLITGLTSAGIIDDAGAGLSVVGPDYFAPEDPATTDLAGLLGALEAYGIITDTD